MKLYSKETQLRLKKKLAEIRQSMPDICTNISKHAQKTQSFYSKAV